MQVKALVEIRDEIKIQILLKNFLDLLNSS